MLVAKPPRIRKINEFTYEDIAAKQISKAFTNLESIRAHFEPLAPAHLNLGIGTLIFRLRDQLSFDSGETVDGLMVRLATA